MIRSSASSQDSTPNSPGDAAPNSLDAPTSTTQLDMETFRHSFEQSPFSIQILSPDGLTLAVNRAF